MPRFALRFFRLLIVVQSLIGLWSVLVPGFWSAASAEGEMLIYQTRYIFLDEMLVTLVYAQVVLCCAMWWPTRWVCRAYVFITLLVGILGLAGGVVVGSALDSFFNYLQTLAMGAMFAVLWIYGYLVKRPSVSIPG